MIHLFPVTELMHHYIVLYFRRCHHKETVEVQISLAAAAAPARFLIPDGNPSVRNPDKRRKKAHPFRDAPDRLIRKPADLLRRNRRQLPPFFNLFLHPADMLCNPVRPPAEDLTDLAFRHIKRCTDNDLRLAGYCDGY